MLLPGVVTGQQQYKFKYRKYLVSQPSSYTDTSKAIHTDTDKSVLSFRILDKKGDGLAFARVTIKNRFRDTALQADNKGFVTITLNSGIYSISIFSLLFTPIILSDYAVQSKTETTIFTSLGQSNQNSIALIYSIRKLRKEEIKKIVDDLSNNNGENELIRNKTCYVLWEI